MTQYFNVHLLSFSIGVASLTFDKTNPNASTHFNCTVSSPSHLNQIHSNLYRNHPFQFSPTISIVGSWLTTSITKTTQFLVTNVQEGEIFYCVLATGPDVTSDAHTDTYLERAVTLYSKSIIIVTICKMCYG